MNSSLWLDSLLEQTFTGHSPLDYMPPWDWACKNVSFKGSVSSAHTRFEPEIAPYLKDPINYWEFTGKIREMTCIGPQQTGKTLAWLIGLVWSFQLKPCLSLVVYESDPKAELINADKVKPVLQNIPALAAELSRPRAAKKDCYAFSSLRSYFMGAGSPTTSFSAKIRVADELDKWVSHEGRLANLDEVRMRARSFDESMLAKVCTVDGAADGSKIWQEFLKSSRGYWHLRCLKCGALSMRSCDIHNLQWEMKESDDDSFVVEDSIRLICPSCKREHGESEKREMNLNGAYIHERPDLLDTRAGFQWGGLAAWAVKDFQWLKIAEAQLLAGRSGDYQDQLKLDNTVRALPHVRRKSNDSELNQLKRHCAPSPSSVKYALMTADTQLDSWYWIVRGFDEKQNSYQLALGKANNADELLAAKNAKYCGVSPVFCLIDQGGSAGRSKEVQALAWSKQGILQYKGYTTIAGLTRWKLSEDDTRLILAQPYTYQSELLYKIYGRSALPTSKAWFLPQDIDATYTEHILDLKPNKAKRSGNDYRNWISSGNDHFFDCEKMMLVANDFYRFLIQKRQNTKETRKCKVERQD